MDCKRGFQRKVGFEKPPSPKHRGLKHTPRVDVIIPSTSHPNNLYSLLEVYKNLLISTLGPFVIHRVLEVMEDALEAQGCYIDKIFVSIVTSLA